MGGLTEKDFICVLFLLFVFGNLWAVISAIGVKCSYATCLHLWKAVWGQHLEYRFVTYTENFGMKVRKKDNSKFPMSEVNQ